jgi:hypothetical protein
VVQNEAEMDAVPTLPPNKITINVFPRDVLQVTITKTCLNVLGYLGKVHSQICDICLFWEDFFLFCSNEISKILHGRGDG